MAITAAITDNKDTVASVINQTIGISASGALTKVGVIYSLSQLVRRKVIISDYDDSEVDTFKATMTSGEGWLDIPLTDYQNFTLDPNDLTQGAYALDAYIAQVLGAPLSDVCCVVDGTDAIVAVINADPLIDDHPDGVLIADAPASAGDTYDFQNQTVIPAGGG